MNSNIAASTTRNLRTTPNNWLSVRATGVFKDHGVRLGPKPHQPFDLAVFSFSISDVTAVKRPLGFGGAGDTGFGADGCAVVLLLTGDFFPWRFRLPRDSGINVPSRLGAEPTVLSYRHLRYMPAERRPTCSREQQTGVSIMPESRRNRGSEAIEE